MRLLERHFAAVNSLLDELRLQNHSRARENISFLLEGEQELLGQIMDACRSNHDHWEFWRNRFDFMMLQNGSTKLSDLRRMLALTDTAILIRSVTARNEVSPAELALIMDEPYLKQLVKRGDAEYKRTKAALIFIAIWEMDDLDWEVEDTSYEQSLQLISENLTFFHDHLHEIIDRRIRRHGELRAYFEDGVSPLNHGAL